MDVLIHISQQLSNSSIPAFEPSAFQVSSNAAAVNMLLFLSLALVLIDAFLAMLVKGWLREFDRGWRTYTVAHLRAQERERRLQELEHWKLYELVALLPILIQGSLLLFCIGLLVLIFPLHLPSAILCSLAFVFVVAFYAFTTYVSIVNSFAPFSSPVSRLLARGLEIQQTSYLSLTHRIGRIISVIRFDNASREQEADANTSHETAQPLSSNNAVGMPTPPHNADSIKRSTVAPRSPSDIDPQTHVHVLERLVSTTAEAVDNIPIFLELLDQPVKDATLRPFNVKKWRELLSITWRLLKNQPTLSVSAAWTLTRAMMICYNRDTADRQLCLTLQHHLASQKIGDREPRMPLNTLFTPYLRFWLGRTSLDDMCRKIAFLEPSDAADAELFWLVNTFHRAMQSRARFHDYPQFFVAVLTYVSSTEQSRRSKVPLTAAVIHAMHAIRSALDRRGGVDSIAGHFILPGTVSTSESVPMTFRQVAGIDTLDLWSDDCIQFVTDILQWDWGSYWHHDIQLSLIAALYIDSTKQADARPTFGGLLKYTRITDTLSQFSDSYDRGKLAVYWYMALFQQPLDQDRDPFTFLYDVIENTITEHSTFRLSGLRILGIAVKHVHETAPCSSDWLKMRENGLTITNFSKRPMVKVDHWVLFHLETILAPQRYLLPEELKKLKWSDTPEKVHIAKARLDLFDSLAKTGHKGAQGPKPDPELLRMFLWAKDITVCTQAFKLCVELVPISQQPSTLGETDSSRMFIPETMGDEWVEHFVHVLCERDSGVDSISWGVLKSHLVPKWNMLPSSWCYDFALSFLFSIKHPLGADGSPAYQAFAAFINHDERQAYLLFLASMLEHIKPSLTWARITSLQSWLASIPKRLESHDGQTRMEYFLAARKQELAEENLGLLAELPKTGSWMDE